MPGKHKKKNSKKKMNGLTAKQKKLEVRLLMFDPKTRKLKFLEGKNENS